MFKALFWRIHNFYCIAIYFFIFEIKYFCFTLSAGMRTMKMLLKKFHAKHFSCCTILCRHRKNLLFKLFASISDSKSSLMPLKFIPNACLRQSYIYAGNGFWENNIAIHKSSNCIAKIHSTFFVAAVLFVESIVECHFRRFVSPQYGLLLPKRPPAPHKNKSHNTESAESQDTDHNSSDCSTRQTFGWSWKN